MGRFLRLKKLFGSHGKHREKSPSAPIILDTPKDSFRVSQHKENLSTVKVQEIAPEPTPKPTPKSLDLWAEAYRQLEARQPELAADYAKHLNTFYGSGGNNNSTNQGRLLSDAGSAVPLVQHLLKDREKKQWRIPLLHKDIKIRAQIEKLTKFCLFTDDIVKTALCNQPHAALAWSAVSILLPMVMSGKIQNDSMLGGFEYIGSVQLYWRIYKRDNHHLSDSSHQEVREALIKLYSHIVEYQARVICHLSSAQLSRVWQKMTDSNDWEGAKRGIAELDAHCCRLVSDSDRAETQRKTDLQLREMQESRAILSEIRQGLQGVEESAASRYNDEKESALLRDLSSEYEHYKNINPLRVEGTCEWLFDDDGFRTWRASTASSLLWMSASPGYGKSVLSRCLIDENRLSNSATTSIVCYFFFQTGTEGQMDSSSALSSMLHQIFIQDPTGELIKLALPSHKNHGDKLKHNFAELWRVLTSCANSYTSGEIICVLDALDECSEESREKFLHALDVFFTLSAHNSTLKFLVTSRPYDDLEEAFKRHTGRSGYVRVDGDDKAVEIGREINIVIDTKVGEIAQDFSESHRKMLSDRLKTMDNRTYLWLHLTFDILKKRRAFLSKSSRIQDLLNSLPGRVSDAYETILNHTSDDPDDRAMTRALLELILAATRPLTLEEANYALTLRVADGDLSSHAEINDQLWPTKGFKTVVKNLSGLFITVCDSRLSFIHLTAREFLSDAKKQGQWHGCFPMDMSHHTMSSVCLQYLSIVDPGTLDGKTEILAQDFPFLPYSLANWSVHYNAQHEDGRRDLCESARKLCNASGGRGERLTGRYTEFGTIAWGIGPDRSSELNIACALGLNAVVAYIIKELDVHSISYDETYGLALVEAAFEGHADVVRTIVKSAEKRQECGEMNNMAFAMAINRIGGDENRQTAVLRALLENADEIRIVDPGDILQAMRMGSREMVSLLLERLGDEIHLTEEVLVQAASNFIHGHEVMNLLLDRRGKEIRINEAVLLAAAGNFKLAREVMAVLLDRRGEEVKITPDVLYAAARNEYPDIWALLLQRRAADVRIDEKLVKLVLGNHRCGLEIIELLFKQRGNEMVVTEELINTAVENRKFGDQMLRVLWGHRGSNIPLTAATLERAAKNPGRGLQIVKLIFSVTGDRIPITEKLIQRAAENESKGRDDLLGFLMEKRGNHGNLSGKRLESAEN